MARPPLKRGPDGAWGHQVAGAVRRQALIPSPGSAATSPEGVPHGWGVSNTLITSFGTGVEARDDIRVIGVDVWALEGVSHTTSNRTHERTATHSTQQPIRGAFTVTT